MKASMSTWWHVTNSQARLRLHGGERPADTVADRIAAAAPQSVGACRPFVEIIEDSPGGLLDSEGYVTWRLPGLTAWNCSGSSETYLFPPFSDVRYDPTVTF